MKLIIKRLHEDAKIPKYQSDKASGFDLHALEDVKIDSLTVNIIRTGLAIQLPPDTEMVIRPRSGLSVKFPGYVANSPGTIDEDYRGEIMIIAYNPKWNADIYVKKGDRIAQGVVCPVIRCEIEEGELDETERGGGGFGSTGIEEVDTKNGKATL